MNSAIVSSPDPTFEEGKGSDELGPNLQLSFSGVLGHAKLGSDWCIWLHMHVILNLIVQHSRIANTATANNTVMLHSCGKLVM